jgi:hypothetical protein
MWTYCQILVTLLDIEVLIEERNMFQPKDLSLEQQFNIHSFAAQVKKMSLEQAQEFLIQMYEESIVRENMYKDLIKHQWGIESPHQNI